LSELALLQARTPRTGFLRWIERHFDIRPYTPALTFDSAKARPFDWCGLIDATWSHNRDKAFPHRPHCDHDEAESIQPDAPRSLLDRTPGLLRDGDTLPDKGSEPSRDCSDEPPLSWTSHSHGIQLEGSALGRVAPFSPYPRLMRPRFLDPLSLFGESARSLLSRLEYRSSSECVCLSLTTGRSQWICLRTRL